MLGEVTAFKAACAPRSVDTRTLRDGHCAEAGTVDVGVFELCNIVSGFSFTPSTRLRSSQCHLPTRASVQFCVVTLLGAPFSLHCCLPTTLRQGLELFALSRKGALNPNKTYKKCLITFYWSIVALHCCVTFCCTAKWISYMYT